MCLISFFCALSQVFDALWWSRSSSNGGRREKEKIFTVLAHMVVSRSRSIEIQVLLEYINLNARKDKQSSRVSLMIGEIQDR